MMNSGRSKLQFIISILRSREMIFTILLLIKKRLLFAIRGPYKDTLPVFLLGCGRSGTSMLLNTFRRDDRVEALGENDTKIAKNFMLVKEQIGPAIENCKAPVLIMKPILNSFDASSLLKSYHRAKIIWIIRDYRDVISSSIIKFGTRVPDYMKNLVLLKQGNNWLSLGIQPETLEMLSKVDSTTFTHFDWMGLIWWSVNRTIILDQLYKHNNFLLLHYENLVHDPDVVLKHIYEFIGLEYKHGVGKYIHYLSVGKGKSIYLHPHVQKLCNDLYEDLKHF